MIFTQRNKIVNGLPPQADAFATSGESDIVSLKNYNHVTFLIMTGASTTANGVVTVLAGSSVSSAATAIAFKYRACTSGDTLGDLTDATSSGFAMTASKASSFYAIEVDASDVAAAGTGYDCVKVKVTEDTDDPQYACIVAILSEPRYAGKAMPTAITD